MVQLLINKEQRDSMVLNARKTFEEKFCTDEYAKRFERLLGGDEFQEINSKYQITRSKEALNKKVKNIF